jgi:hypothetical protein
MRMLLLSLLLLLLLLQVLQPDDVFTSVDELLGSRPDLRCAVNPVPPSIAHVNFLLAYVRFCWQQCLCIPRQASCCMQSVCMPSCLVPTADCETTTDLSSCLQSLPCCPLAYVRECYSIFREILEELNMTTIWPPNCVWVSDGYYQGELYQCRRPNVTDRCIPCWQSSYTCGWNGDYSFMQEGCDGFGYYPWMPELMRRLTSSRSLQQAVFTNASDATRAIEGYAGTMAFPNNKVRATSRLLHVVCLQKLVRCCVILSR